ncbi:MAG: hypothetical protein LAT67_12520 [Balneolales bacterium]|nr:hypothetical protein [Balneolales bacterium]
MKALLHTTFITLIFIFITAGFAYAQTVHVVNNTSGAPDGSNVYASIQEAIDAASDGDVLHIIPSGDSYGNFTLNKSLQIYGIGFNPDTDAPGRSLVGQITITSSGSNSSIEGVVASTINFEDPQEFTVSNILIQKSRINGLRIPDNPSDEQQVAGLILQGNIIHASSVNNSSIDFPTDSKVSNFVVSNNIFTGNNHRIKAGNGAIFRNNLFLSDGSSASYTFLTLRNALVANNIFLGSRPNDFTQAVSITETSFQNNLSFGSSNDEFPLETNDNSGSGNLVNIDPQFASLDASDDVWQFSSWDATLESGSPAIGAGTDGTDLGIFGGSNPLDMTGVPLPLIQLLDVPALVGQNEDLDITIRARGN